MNIINRLIERLPKKKLAPEFNPDKFVGAYERGEGFGYNQALSDSRQALKKVKVGLNTYELMKILRLKTWTEIIEALDSKVNDIITIEDIK